MKPILSNPVHSHEETILLTDKDGWYNIRLSQIIYSSCDNTYTEFYLTDGRKIVVSSPLRYYEQVLASLGFFRIHQSHLVNTLHILSITKKNSGWYALMSNDVMLPISRDSKGALIEKLQLLSVVGISSYPKKTPVGKSSRSKRETGEVNLKINRNEVPATKGTSSFLSVNGN